LNPKSSFKIFNIFNIPILRFIILYNIILYEYFILIPIDEILKLWLKCTITEFNVTYLPFPNVIESFVKYIQYYLFYIDWF
jgi:hypothetical protein